jgi:hypothetical protein
VPFSSEKRPPHFRKREDYDKLARGWRMMADRVERWHPKSNRGSYTPSPWRSLSASELAILARLLLDFHPCLFAQAPTYLGVLILHLGHFMLQCHGVPLWDCERKRLRRRDGARHRLAADCVPNDDSSKDASSRSIG